MADTICSERGAARGMERDCRCLVGNFVFLFLSFFTTDFACSAVQSLLRITVSLYVNMAMRNDIIVGRYEILCEPQVSLRLRY
jgi:hypothetical protein